MPMEKNLTIFTLSFISVFAFVLSLFFVVFCCISKLTGTFDIRLAYPFALAIPFCLTLSKNFIAAIRIKNKTVTFYAVQNYKILIKKLDLCKIAGCKMNITTVSVAAHSGIKLSLDIEFEDNKNNLILDYDCIGDIPVEIIKKFCLLRHYIENFSYSLNLSEVPKRKREIERFFENNMQESFSDRILNYVGSISFIFVILFGFIIIYALIIDL